MTILPRCLIDNNCVDCGVDTWEISEYYMVNFDLWHAHGVGDGMLCIGCLENRLNRPLTPEDFHPCPLNADAENDRLKRSERLRERLESR